MHKHRRGLPAYKRYKERTDKQFDVRSAYVRNCFHDSERDESINTPKCEAIVLAQMKKELGYTQSDIIVQGEVIFWPGGESPHINPIVSKGVRYVERPDVSARVPSHRKYVWTKQSRKPAPRLS